MDRSLALRTEHEVNQGYGAAVFDGLVGGVKEWAFFTDGDLQFVLDELERLWTARGEADLIIGYRAPRRDSFIRKVNGFGFLIIAIAPFINNRDR